MSSSAASAWLTTQRWACGSGTTWCIAIVNDGKRSASATTIVVSLLMNNKSDNEDASSVEASSVGEAVNTMNNDGVQCCGACVISVGQPPTKEGREEGWVGRINPPLMNVYSSTTQFTLLVLLVVTPNCGVIWRGRGVPPMGRLCVVALYCVIALLRYCVIAFDCFPRCGLDHYMSRSSSPAASPSVTQVSHKRSSISSPSPARSTPSIHSNPLTFKPSLNPSNPPWALTLYWLRFTCLLYYLMTLLFRTFLASSELRLSCVVATTWDEH